MTRAAKPAVLPKALRTFRGLAGRALYFHNGSAKTLEDVVQFYKDRFNLPLSGDQVNDLANFLRSL